MIPKPLKAAALFLSDLQRRGCVFRIEESQLVVHDPNKVLSSNEDIKPYIKANKLQILAYLQRQAMVKLLRTLEMAQPEIPIGIQEDYSFALLAATRCIGGDIWEEDLDVSGSTSHS